MNAPPSPPRPSKSLAHQASLDALDARPIEQNPFLSSATPDTASHASQPDESLSTVGDSTSQVFVDSERAPTPQVLRSHSSTGGPVDRRPQGAPLRVDPTIVTPHYKDPDAEFRKGAWRKPLFFLMLAAAFVGALAYLVPSKAPISVLDSRPESSRAVIGSSVAPEVNQHDEQVENQARLQALPDKKKEGSQATSPPQQSRQGSFAAAFKKGAAP